MDHVNWHFAIYAYHNDLTVGYYRRGEPIKSEHVTGVMGVIDWDSRSGWFLAEGGDWYIFRSWFDPMNPWGAGQWSACDFSGLGDFARSLKFRRGAAVEGRTVDNDQWSIIQKRMHADLAELRTAND